MGYRQAGLGPLESSYLDSPENLQIHQKAMDDSNPRWQQLYQAALLELDHDKLLQCIEQAEEAIREHAVSPPEPTPRNPHELQAMQDALRALSLLRRTTLRE
jgi:hypothetical protein